MEETGKQGFTYVKSYNVQLVHRFVQHLGCLVSQVSIGGAMEAIAPDLILLPQFPGQGIPAGMLCES